MEQRALVAVVVLACAGWAVQAVAQTAISADGVVESTAGGFKFPDASVQTSASLPEHVRMVVVSPVGTASENGTFLLDVLASISPDAGNPYLLKIEPGVYDLGASQFQTKQYLDVEGSGQGVTRIRGNYVRGGALSGFVQVVSNSELRMLTVENYGGSNNSFAGIDVWNEVNVRISDVTVLVHSGNHHWGVETGGGGTVIRNVTIRCTGGSENIGLHLRADNVIVDNANVRAVDGSYANYGIILDSILDQTITNSVVEASGAASTANTGLYNQGGSHPDVFNCVIRAFGAADNYAIRNRPPLGATGAGGDIEIQNSRISGEDWSVLNESTDSVYVGASQLKGPVSNTGTGSIKCANTCDESFDELNSSCG